MFIGHFGVGFGAKKVISETSLGTMFLASQFIDLLWPLFLLLGIEQVKIDPGNTVVTPLNFIYYPFSHSLIAVLIWAVLFAGVYFLLKKDLKVALWLGFLVISHWILDLLTHRPDLPLLFNNETMVGFGLWNSLIFTVLVEGSIFAAGIYLYLKVTSSKNRTGTIAVWSLIGFLVIIYISNLFGPPPPSEEPISIIGLSQWLLIAWAYWIDRNRSVV
jgi:hypothetical protein